MHVLLVEDDLVLADGLARYLTSEGMAVEVTHSGSQADLRLQRQLFGVMVLDIGLPGLDGLTVLRRQRARNSTMPVLLITARDAVKDRVDGLELGADDYIVKPFEPVELVARIRAVVRRTAGPREKLAAGGLVMDLTAKRLYVDDHPIEVSTREWSTLEYLLRNLGRVVSKPQIMNAILGWGEELSENAVEVYLSRIRFKLAGARIKIRTVRGFGYSLEEVEVGSPVSSVEDA